MAEARLAKLKAEVAELEKRQGARSQDTLLLDPDIMQLSSGRVVCKVCTGNSTSLMHLAMQRSLWLCVNGGINLDRKTKSGGCSRKSRRLFYAKGPPKIERKRKKRRTNRRERELRRGGRSVDRAPAI